MKKKSAATAIRIRKYRIECEFWESDYEEAGYKSRAEFERDLDKWVKRLMDRIQIGASWKITPARNFFYLGGAKPEAL